MKTRSTRSAFPEISKIQFEGPDSKNPLAFRHYNPEEMVDGKTMKDHLRFSVTYWHTFTSQSEMDGLDKVTKAFNQKYPKVVVNSENVPNADFMAKFTLAVQGGGKPETTMISSVRLPDMVTMGGLIDLTARVNSEREVFAGG